MISAFSNYGVHIICDPWMRGHDWWSNGRTVYVGAVLYSEFMHAATWPAWCGRVFWAVT